MADDDATALFFELFTGLPRQGPGSPECTRRALELIPPLGPTAWLLDIGCGVGAQTLDLARLSAARIVAVDLHAPFVSELNRSAARLGFAGRVQGIVADMNNLPIAHGLFDVLWSEGAIYNIGFDRGLTAWRGLLRRHGHLAVSELCWLNASPAPECLDWLTAEYPAVRDVPANRRAIERAGYEPIGDFRLPASAWWDDYYAPLERNLSAFRARHGDDPAAIAIADQTAREIAMFRCCSGEYGYVFFVMRRQEG